MKLQLPFEEGMPGTPRQKSGRSNTNRTGTSGSCSFLRSIRAFSQCLWRESFQARLRLSMNKKRSIRRRERWACLQRLELANPWPALRCMLVHRWEWETRWAKKLVFTSATRRSLTSRSRLSSGTRRRMRAESCQTRARRSKSLLKRRRCMRKTRTKLTS